MEKLQKAKNGYNDTLWYHCLVFSLAYYCRGDLKRACLVLEETIQKAKRVPKRVLASIHSELAYYYAERYSQQPLSQFRTSALSHYEKSMSAYDGNMPERNTDSLGYVLIETGNNIQTIQQGLEMCGSAISALLQESTTDEHTRKAGEFFLKLHTEIAYKHIAELASSDCDSAITHAVL